MYFKEGGISRIEVGEMISEITHMFAIFGHQNLMASAEEKGEKRNHSDMRNECSLVLRCLDEHEKRYKL